ncbi:hypothetical protein HPB50_003034 [Hyalomma asiaticum]|uniref:Uncharacterized protein n=1 Tax=Hyalomma asiaticum TaxID=266040 RepID=A0ACB7SAZ6_HYAAI|nr:hypothetical protein HPB50_003034 [Hyalomma asiaticum]
MHCLYRTPALTGLSAASAGVSLASDLMLIQAVKFGSFYSTMLNALRLKMFVISFDFFENIAAFYTCMQDVNFLWYTVYFTGTLLAIKGVALFIMYDFYEGVKQQGTLLSRGLVDLVPEHQLGTQPIQALNCAFMSYSMLIVLQGLEKAPHGLIFRFIYIVVSGLSLCGDVMLYTAVNSGSETTCILRYSAQNILKKMRLALCVKAFVITMDFFTPCMHQYNCCQDGVVLYYIHDFYAGVKQQGTMASHGLQDADDLQKPEQQANTVQVIQMVPGVYPGGGLMIVGAPVAAGGNQPLTAQDYMLAGQRYPSPAPGASYPRAMHFVPHPPPR